MYIRWHVERGFPLEWFDGQGDHPKYANELGLGSLGTVEAVLAHTAEARSGVRSGARALASRAWANLQMHRDTGAAHIGIEESPPRELDYVVYLGDADPGGGTNRTGKRSALSIEFGHLYKSPDGEIKRIGGIYVLTGAVGTMARTPGREFK
jgi:hypothetical protein